MSWLIMVDDVPGWPDSRSWVILVSVGKLISVILLMSIIYPGRGRVPTLAGG